MLKWLKKKFKKKEIQQTCFVYCPKCKNELASSNSFVKDEDFVYYECTQCGEESKWDFDFPVPTLIK